EKGHTRACTHKYILTRSQTHTYTHTHTPSYKPAVLSLDVPQIILCILPFRDTPKIQPHTQTHFFCPHTQTHSQRLGCTHTHTHTHTQTNVHTHTHTHTVCS